MTARGQASSKGQTVYEIAGTAYPATPAQKDHQELSILSSGHTAIVTVTVTLEL